MQIEEKLEAARIIKIKGDLREMTRDELAQYFASKRSGKIKLERLMRAIIWQAYERIQSGEEPSIQGNIRSMWYRWVKPVLSHISDDNAHKTDPSKVMSHVLKELVMKHRLFRYADFDFTDENWSVRKIGLTRPEVLVFAEKRGWVRFLERIHEELGVSTLALGGSPSALTSEYTVTQLHAVTSSPVQLIGIVDFDPSGDQIAKALEKQLCEAGLEVSGLTTVIDPAHYSDRELKIYRFPLPRKQKTKTARWIEQTGGVGGAFGLEAESLPWDRVRALIDKAIGVPVADEHADARAKIRSAYGRARLINKANLPFVEIYDLTQLCELPNSAVPSALRLMVEEGSAKFTNDSATVIPSERHIFAVDHQGQQYLLVQVL